MAEYKREYRAANRSEIASYDYAYREANAERLLADARERSSAWRRENPDKARAKDSRRRALKAGAFVEDVDVMAVYESEGGSCFVCREPIDLSLKFPDRESLTLEHVIPLALGGKHAYENCSVSHYGCNSSKGSMAPKDFTVLP